MSAAYFSGFLTGVGAGTAGIWAAMGHTLLACVAASVAVAGITTYAVVLRNKAKASA